MEKSSTLNLRAFALATLVPVIMMMTAMWFKPLWRDEYFSLFYSDPQQNLSYLSRERWNIDAHPPFYNPFLWLWGHISQNPFWQKSLSLVFLGLGALSALKLTHKSNRRQFFVFCLICLGSYWVIYFATEIRPYILNFVLSTLLTLTMVRLYETQKPDTQKTGASPNSARLMWLLWLVLGASLSLTHYFGALWFACLGFTLGVAKLLSGSKAGFAAAGLLTVTGLIPALFWMQYSLNFMEFSGVVSDTGFGAKLQAGTHQFLRGLIVKTFGSNPLITFLGIGAIWAGLSARRTANGALIKAASLTIILAFMLHLFVVDMIKERAFIVIMPALLWVMAGQAAETDHKWARFVPLVTIIMPFMFIPEYFKNKEEIPQLRAALEHFEPACANTDLPVYYRPDPPQAFYKWASGYILDPKPAQRLVDISKLSQKTDTGCPVLAISVLLPKNHKAMIEEATAYLLKAGYQLENIELKKFGKGRSLLWLHTPDN